jgi:hypothetical protein
MARMQRVISIDTSVFPPWKQVITSIQNSQLQRVFQMEAQLGCQLAMQITMRQEESKIRKACRWHTAFNSEVARIGRKLLYASYHTFKGISSISGP